jgi:hypothetical protein
MNEYFGPWIILKRKSYPNLAIRGKATPNFRTLAPLGTLPKEI